MYNLLYIYYNKGIYYNYCLLNISSINAMESDEDDGHNRAVADAALGGVAVPPPPPSLEI